MTKPQLSSAKIDARRTGLFLAVSFIIGLPLWLAFADLMAAGIPAMAFGLFTAIVPVFAFRCFSLIPIGIVAVILILFSVAGSIVRIALSGSIALIPILAYVVVTRLRLSLSLPAIYLLLGLAIVTAVWLLLFSRYYRAIRNVWVCLGRIGSEAISGLLSLIEWLWEKADTWARQLAGGDASL